MRVWSCRKLSEELGVSKSTVQRILVQAQLRPHRLDRYMASNDPAFEAKAADILPPLRFGQFLLNGAEHFLQIEWPASIRSEGVRAHPGAPFGFRSETAFGFAGILRRIDPHYPRSHTTRGASNASRTPYSAAGVRVPALA